MALEQRRELLRQVQVHQVARGQVHRQAQLQPLVGQRQPVARGLFEHPHRQVADEAGLLRERNELRRRHEPALRMLPAHQRLGADHAAVVERQLWLQVEAQLVAVDGLAQFGDQRQRLCAGGVDRRVVGHRPVAAALGGVHRHLGADQQGVVIVGVLRPAGDADAGAHVDLVLAERQRQVQRLFDAQRDGVGLLRIGAMQQDAEFVAAESSHDVAVACQRPAQALGDAHQHLVADAVAQHVVDVLEAVQVQHDDGDRAPRAARQHLGAGVADRIAHRLAEARPVGQSRETVPVGQPQDLRLVLGHADAHALERLRQLADLVLARQPAHRRDVVAGAQPLGGVGQAAQRGRDPARGDDAAGREDGDGHQRDDDQRDLQVGRQPHGVVDRQRDECQHAGVGAMLGTERQRAHAQLVALREHRRHAALRHRRHPGVLGEFVGARAIEARQVHGPRLARRRARQQGQVEAGQVAHVAHQLAIERKRHQHPADQQRCLHRHQHGLVRAAADQRDGVGVAGGDRLRGKVRGHRCQLAGMRRGGGAQLEVVAQEGRLRRPDAGAVVGQHGDDGVGVVGTQGLAKAVVRGQQLRAVGDRLRLAIEQVLQQALSFEQLGRQLAMRVAGQAGAQGGEADELHGQQQRQEQHDDACGERSPPPAVARVHFGDPPVPSLTRCSTSPSATTSGTTIGGAFSASVECHTCIW